MLLFEMPFSVLGRRVRGGNNKRGKVDVPPNFPKIMNLVTWLLILLRIVLTVCTAVLCIQSIQRSTDDSTFSLITRYSLICITPISHATYHLFTKDIFKADIGFDP
eukprot:TRINITY_DN576_c0_g3_i3.p1 TRINITY_DN576_c0_g3~~TRINITY_DN576_c0_g3_i3.p1  ORF type:complete len:106 (-),score=4.37 TRINITY_DN576_c0_g3_i3:87-404(-)